MGWTDNLLSYLKTGDCGKCPKCGGENVVVQTHEDKVRTSYSFFCPNCRSGDHFDGITKDTDCSQMTDNTLNLPSFLRLGLLRKGEKVLCKRCKEGFLEPVGDPRKTNTFICKNCNGQLIVD